MDPGSELCLEESVRDLELADQGSDLSSATFWLWQTDVSLEMSYCKVQSYNLLEHSA
jgi:hypothetical protein